MNNAQTDSHNKHGRLTELIETHQRRLYLYIYSLVHRTDDAHDVLQETNFALWRDADRVEAVADFHSWAYRVAFNQVLAYRKRQVRDRLQFDDVLVTQLAEDMEQQDHCVTSHQAALRSCSKKLPPREQRLLAMRYTSGYSVRVISEQLGVTIAAVSKSLYRTRSALRKCILAALNTNRLDHEE